MSAPAAASSSQSPTQPASHNLTERIDQQLRKNDLAIKMLLQEQLYQFPENRFSEAFYAHQFTDLTSADTQTWTDAVLKYMPTIDKMTVLMRSIGHLEVCTILGEPSHQAEEMKKYEEEVAQWTDGIVSCRKLSRFKALRSLFFAAMDTCLDSNEKVFEVVRNELPKIFSLMEEKPLQDKELIPILKGICDVLPGLEQLQGMLKANIPVQQRKLEAVAMMIGILRLLQKGCQDPLHLMPILFHPLCRQPIVNSEQLGNLDTQAAAKWFGAFHRSFCIQSAPFLQILKQKAKSSAVIEYQKLIDHSQKVTSTLCTFLDRLNQFRNLKPRDQLGNLDQIRDIQKDLESFHLDTTVLLAWKKWVAATIGNDKRLSNQHLCYVLEPLENVLSLSRTIHTCLKSICVLYCDSYPTLEKLLAKPYPYGPLGHITVIDHLQHMLQKSNSDLTVLIEQGKVPAEIIAKNAILQRGFEYQFLMVFTDMRRYFHMRRLADAPVDIRNARFLQNVAAEVKQCLLDPQMPQEIGSVLETYLKVSELLISLLPYERWPDLFIISPLASDKKNAVLENQFYLDYFSHLRASFFKVDFESEYQKVCELMNGFKTEEKEFQPEIKQAFDKAKAALRQAQNELRACPSNLKEVLSLWDRLVQCQEIVDRAFEKVEVSMKRHLIQNPNPSASFKKILQSYLPSQQSALESFIFSPGHSLLSYIESQEIIKEEAEVLKERLARKEQRLAQREEERRKAALKSIAPALEVEPPRQIAPAASASWPERTGDLFSEFRRQCRALQDFCCSFAAPASTANSKLSPISLQEQYASNLMRNLQTLEELFQATEQEHARNFVALETAERLAIVLEQSFKLVNAINRWNDTVSDTPDPILENMGRECFLNPHNLNKMSVHIDCDHVKKTLKRFFNEEDRNFLKSLGSIAAVTYRHPASGQDCLTEALIHGEGLRSMLRKGIALCHKILMKVDTSLIKPAINPETVSSQDDRLINSFPPDVVDHEQTFCQHADELILRCQDRLERIHRLRSVKVNRLVPPLGKGDKSHNRRSGTIDGALKDLRLNLDICEELLLGKANPSLALVYAEAALSRQGAILEEALLILLAHLPCPSIPKSKEHCLWDIREGRQRPLRYAHDLKEYVSRLLQALPEASISRDPSGKKLQNIAERLTAYLMNGHRYHEPGCAVSQLRDRIADLSAMRRRLAKMESDEPLLKKLDGHLHKILHDEVKVPLLETLALVDELLATYQELLKPIR